LPIHNFSHPQGRIETLTIQSSAIANNVLGDPHERDIAVYLPPGYDRGEDDYPLFVDIVGYTGSGLAHLGWKMFGESLPQRLDRLIAEGKMGPVILALPDCFTSLGGNQYINSSAMGNWADFLIHEMVPALETRYRIRPGAGNRALFGKSSGGYGAIAHGLLYGDHWGAIACHSGDMCFDWVYRSELPQTLQGIQAKGSITAFMTEFSHQQKPGDRDVHTLMMLAMAATYDPDPELPFGVRLPITMDTCELIEERWQSWLEHDPIKMVDNVACQSSLKKLKGIFIDCGRVDQYFLVYGSRIMHKKLDALGISHEYQEFDDNHSGIDYRMDVSLPFLFNAIMGTAE